MRDAINNVLNRHGIYAQDLTEDLLTAIGVWIEGCGHVEDRSYIKVLAMGQTAAPPEDMKEN